MRNSLVLPKDLGIFASKTRRHLIESDNDEDQIDKRLQFQLDALT